MRALVVVPITAILLTACSGGGVQSTDGSPRPARREVNSISEEEIRASARQTVYEVVQTLRPTWLNRPRPTTVRPDQESTLQVYVDGQRFGDVEALRQILASTVRAIRFFTAAEAQGRFGSGHLLGVIEVTTRGY